MRTRDPERMKRTAGAVSMIRDSPLSVGMNASSSTETGSICIHWLIHVNGMAARKPKVVGTLFHFRSNAP